MPTKSPEELQAIIDGMNQKIALLEAKTQQTEAQYKVEKKELEQEIHTLRATAGNGMGAMGMPMMGMGGMPMGMGGMGMGVPMMGMGTPPMPGQDQAVSPQMQQMQMLMCMAQANPAMMPQCMQMMQMMMGMGPQPAAGTTPMPFASSAAPAAPVSSVTSSSRPAASLSVSAHAPGATLEGGSTVAQLRALQAEKDKLASRSVSASNRADSASKIASIKANALARQETAVELCILMDCTGSMGSYIEQAKQTAALIVKQARDKYAVDLRVAFVGYRDFCDSVRFEVKDFVAGEHIDEVTKLLMLCTATGGGDAPEDVAGGLEKALHLSWSQSSSRIKMIVHVADAPAHGSEYHDGLVDNHDGVQNPDPAEMMRQLGDKKVAYYFFKINNSTDKMIAKLKEAHKNSRREFKVHELGKGNEFKFADIVLGSIASSAIGSEDLEGLMKDLSPELETVQPLEAAAVGPRQHFSPATTKARLLEITAFAIDKHAMVRQTDGVGGMVGIGDRLGYDGEVHSFVMKQEQLRGKLAHELHFATEQFVAHFAGRNVGWEEMLEQQAKLWPNPKPKPSGVTYPLCVVSRG